MGGYASVQSFEALQRLRVALCRFAELAGSALDEADAEVQRARDWVKHDQVGYWKREGEKRSERYNLAKRTLARKQSQKTALGGRPNCDEEEKELKIATRRLEEARQKVGNVRRWNLKIDQEAYAYQAVAGGLSQMLGADVPNALARLDGMLAALEAYAAVGPVELQTSEVGAGEGAATGAAGVGSMARTAPVAPLDAGARWRRLRSAAPTQAHRDAAPPAPAETPAAAAGGPGPAWAAALARLRGERAAVAPPDRIVLARGAARLARIYLVRCDAAGAGDSGWYLGNLDDPAATEHEARATADLLALRPELAPVLALPPGSLVVIDGPALAAVLDRADNLLWPVTGGGAAPPRDAGGTGLAGTAR
jgi:hypothetical protein